MTGTKTGERQFPLPLRTPKADVLAHLQLLVDHRPTHAAVLLFGRDPQRFLPVAEVRCMHFHGTEIQRPVPYLNERQIRALSHLKTTRLGAEFHPPAV